MENVESALPTQFIVQMYKTACASMDTFSTLEFVSLLLVPPPLLLHSQCLPDLALMSTQYKSKVGASASQDITYLLVFADSALLTHSSMLLLESAAFLAKPTKSTTSSPANATVLPPTSASTVPA